MTIQKCIKASVLVLGTVALVGCSGMNTTQQRTLSGAGIGAATGAVAGVATGGCVSCGAAIGAGVGAAGGYLYDKSRK
jgi:osmotically inducible lipoprotein OsmB